MKQLRNGDPSQQESGTARAAGISCLLVMLVGIACVSSATAQEAVAGASIESASRVRVGGDSGPSRGRVGGWGVSSHNVAGNPWNAAATPPTFVEVNPVRATPAAIPGVVWPARPMRLQSPRSSAAPKGIKSEVRAGNSSGSAAVLRQGAGLTVPVLAIGGRGIAQSLDMGRSGPLDSRGLSLRPGER
jgi:hypothetical protein